MTITARYAATCTTCHQAITPGQQIEWTRGARDVQHTRCAAGVASGRLAPPATAPAPRRTTGGSRTCASCGHVERRDARGYAVGDWVRGGECQSCREERRMGY